MEAVETITFTRAHSVIMVSRLSVVSTPNLYNVDEAEYHYKGSDTVNPNLKNRVEEITTSFLQIHPPKRINFRSETDLNRASSRGSKVQIMTSFVNIATINGTGSNKGVHFCPVVSEVNWRDSFSTEESGSESESQDVRVSSSVEDDDGDDEEEEKKSLSTVNSRSMPCIRIVEEVGRKRESSPQIPMNALVAKLSRIATDDEGRKMRRLTKRDDFAIHSHSYDERLDRDYFGAGCECGANENEINYDEFNVCGDDDDRNNRHLRNHRTRRRHQHHPYPHHRHVIYESSSRTGRPFEPFQRVSSSANTNTSSSNTNSNVSSSSFSYDRAFPSIASRSDSIAMNNSSCDSSSSTIRNRETESDSRDSGGGDKDAVNNNAPAIATGTDSKGKSKSKIGGFFQRFSLRRLSGRRKQKKSANVAVAQQPPVVVGCVPKTDATVPYSRIIPLSGEPYEDQDTTDNVSSKPPLPPFGPTRRRSSGVGGGDADGDFAPSRFSTSSPLSAAERLQYSSSQKRCGNDTTTTRSTTMIRNTSPCIDPANARIGLLETDIDSNVTQSNNGNVNCSNNSCNTPGGNKKSRSLLNLDDGRMSSTKLITPAECVKTASPHHNCNDYRAKSMEFLLDKENQDAIKAPENELQKGERKISEHELRIQRSLQKLNVPEWYKNSSVPAQGFLLKRHSDVGYNSGTHSHHRWNANTLPSKTTSLSSLGSNQSPAPKSPTYSAAISPGPTQYSFSRWSTSRLNSGTNSSSTSPCSSARSSFNYRQPYLGWRSQERLSRPRTPAERLAAGLLPPKSQNGSQQSSPSLTEVRSSIKEVTSAIVHYVSGTRDSSDRLSPSLKFYTDSSSRSTSPRGSTGKLCWLESSFVGNKPPNVPETPSSAASETKFLKSSINANAPRDACSNNNYSSNSQKYSENQTCNRVNDPVNAHQLSEAKRRRSDGLDLFLQTKGPNRRVSYDPRLDSLTNKANNIPGSSSSSSSIVQCRNPKCSKYAEPAEAKRKFKICHNCEYVYCSRECRRDHWEKHRKLCLHSRTGDLCRRALYTIKHNDAILLRASKLARRGFLENGRGCVKFYFHSPQMAEQFVNGNFAPPDAAYVKWSELITPAVVESETYNELMKVCKTYNPDTKLILFVAVHVVSEVPNVGGVVKWERHIIYRYSKTKLSSELLNADASNATAEACLHENPKTLILTSLPGDRNSRKDREVTFANIQNHLRQRGVDLRKQFPDVHAKLCDYVKNENNFAPTTIYPRDAASGKTFMCVIMPDAEPNKLDFLTKRTIDAQTVNVSDLKMPSSSID